jgi:hypothetical protein
MLFSTPLGILIHITHWNCCTSLILRSASHYGNLDKRTLNKLPSRGPLKYTNCGVCVSLKRKRVSAQGEFGFPLLPWTNFPLLVKFLAPKLTKKYCHICIFEDVVFWLLASSVKFQCTNFCSSSIKLLEPFVF